jgi:hypothetical protein
MERGGLESKAVVTRILITTCIVYLWMYCLDYLGFKKILHNILSTFYDSDFILEKIKVILISEKEVKGERRLGI